MEASKRGIAAAARSLIRVEEVGKTLVFLILVSLVLLGPLAYLFGVDSRRSTDRGWVGTRR